MSGASMDRRFYYEDEDDGCDLPAQLIYLVGGEKD